MNTEILEKVGFTKGEIRVYLSLLELGESTTGAIIKKSKITGSKVYEILDRLIEKGLASYIIREKTKYFQVSSPKRLLDYINRKEKEISQQKNEIEGIIPTLESIQKSKQKTQSSQIFEGYEGMRTVFNLILDSLKSNEEYCAFTLGVDLKDKKTILFLKNYHQRRIRRKIKAKIIANREDAQIFKKHFYKMKYAEIRYYPQPMPMGVFIFKDYVATVSTKDKPIVFLIKSERVANSYKKFFESLWKKSKP